MLKTLNDNPLIMIIPNFLTDLECDHLIQLADPLVTRSLVVDDQAPSNSVDDIRTSLSAAFLPGFDDVIQLIEFKIAYLTGVPIHHQEGLQVVKYEEGQFYGEHYDYFDLTIESHRQHHMGNQRSMTVLLYLNDQFEDGDTVFSELNLIVKPSKGTALWFYNVKEDGSNEPLTLHAGLPPKNGVKWIANKWIREKPL